MKFGRTLALTLATMLLAAPLVHAQDDDMGELTTRKPRKQTAEEENKDPSRSGPLLGVGALYGLDNFSNLPFGTDGSGGFSLHAGYRFNKWISSELRMDDFVQFDAHAGGVDVGEVNGWYLGLDQKAYLLHGRFQPFLLAGLGYLVMETSNNAGTNPNKTDDGCGLHFGGGLDIYATEKVVVTTDISYVLGVGDVDDYGVTVFGLGLLYRP